MLPRRHLWNAVFVLCAIAALKGAWDLVQVISLEASGAIDSDGLLYFTVGRGILNHVTPYVGLFESKPPGMFLVAALSLLTTGNERLALALQILIYVFLPTGLAVFAWRTSVEKPRIERSVLAATGVLLGILLALYLQQRAGGVQGEAFGTAFAFAFFLAFLAWEKKNDVIRTIILGILLAAGIGMKEPFLLTITGGMLLLVKDGRHFLRCYVIPLGIAAGLGLLVLVGTGWLDPYLHTYLPGMLHGRVEANPIEPPWIRGFTAGRLLGNLTTYHTAPLLGYLLGLLWMFAPILRSHRTPKAPDIGLSLLTAAAVYKAMIFAFFFLVTWKVSLLHMTLEQSILPIPGFSFFLLLIVCAVLLWCQWKRGFLVSSLLVIIALYLATYTVGISIYAVNHFAFAVPVYLALALLFLRHAAGPHASSVIVWPVIALTVLSVFAYRSDEVQFRLVNNRLQYGSARHIEEVLKVDAMLDACTIDRYGSVDAFLALAFARHSPVGPLFVWNYFDYLGADNVLFAQTRANLEKAQVIISAEGPDSPRVADLIAARFTEKAPPCATPFLPITGLRVYFPK
ncbi:hypothetical protein EXS70_03565 [Candidatus Peribacteria bacterium]|nr:hypothetical protein [Candidatus Peribacteria bacterium]